MREKQVGGGRARIAGGAMLAAFLAAGPLLVALSRPAAAKPAHLKAMAEQYGPFMPAALNNCSTCHLPSTTGKAPHTLADFPHNAFGKRLMAVEGELRAAGKRADISHRLRALAAQDSDADGSPDEQEILAGRRPGDPADKPTAAQRSAVEKQRPRLAAYLTAYRWRPFEPVRRPAVPKLRNAAWARNPIDAFLGVEHEKRGLRPRPQAGKAVLLRRVYLDLIGLSPTPEELRAFLADRSPNAYEKVVDQLLASPRYGERWGRHWMDVWRYSDWTGWGEQVRDSQPHIWRWRDWIVESMNGDKGYDRMIVEMLAADEAAPTDPDALRATGFLVRNFKLLSREKWMEDTVDHTAQAFLGLTVGCARCHDHMYDPITQKEYYRFRAVFEPHNVRTDWVPGELETKKDGLVRAFDAKPADPTYLYVRGDERQPVKEEPLPPGVPEALGGSLRIEPVALPLLARVPEKQPHVIAALRANAASRVEAARKAAEACRTPEEAATARLRLDAAENAQNALKAVLRVEQLEDSGRKDSPEWQAAATATVEAQRRLALAEAAVGRADVVQAVSTAEKAMPLKPDELKKAKEAQTAAETALATAEAALKTPATTAYKPRITSNYPATSTGRRLALARWIASRDNPLTARVAVNHIWLRHFGRALAPTVSDLGLSGAPPTHPQLLDWLASELMARGWQMKPLHRLLVTSSAYRMASTPDPANAAKDADNHYLWRTNSRRMDAEIVRDNAFYVCGQLDLKLGGPEIDQHQGMTVKRRSLYFRHAQEKQMPFLGIFDGPNVVECYSRKETVIPQQALALANSELALVQSRLLARSLAEKHGADAAAFVRAAFERVLARPATAAEVAECTAFLRKQPALFPVATVVPVASTAPAPADASKPSPDPALRARENLILVLLNHHDFVTIR